METHTQEKFLSPARDQMAGNSQKSWSSRGTLLHGMLTTERNSSHRDATVTERIEKLHPRSKKAKVSPLLPAEPQEATTTATRKSLAQEL